MSSYSEDNVIIEAILSGETEKIDFLISKYKKSLYLFIKRRVRNPDISEELTQDTFCEAYKNLKRFKGKSKFTTWLYAIAINLTRNYFNNAKRERLFLSEVALASYPDNDGLPLEYLEKKTRAKSLMEILEAMKPGLKEVFILVVFEDLPYEEVAQIMNIPVGTVKSRMFRARKELKQKIKKLDIK